MLPVVPLGPLNVSTYAVCVLLAIAVGFVVRRREVARLGYEATPGHRWVGVGALVGAVVGAKLGMVLFDADLAELGRRMLDPDFTGKTVVGGIGGGYLGVEITKRLVGVTHSTGDAFAVSLPLAQAIGRVGCFLHGCCPGVPWDGPWAVTLDVPRHPAPLYETAGDLLLAGALWSVRRAPRPAGELFRLYLVGYALLRFSLEPLRADANWGWGPLTSVQWVCLATAAGFSVAVARARRVTRA